ncbi:hypothetical protein AB1287_06760 [Enterobacter asburiae]|uniref:hypothetical protein n=1 Tax=Scandinavium sp. UTDF21-P1B TaxID=3446379 RepID=UPI00347F178C
MREFSFYSGVSESALYRYHIRETGQVYHVTICLQQDDAEEQIIGHKVLRNITRQDVIRECVSHCRRRSVQDKSCERTEWLTRLRNWALCSLAVVAFIRLMMLRS